MTPDEARAHAYAILDAANAAETDAILVGFLRDKVGLKEGTHRPVTAKIAGSNPVMAAAVVV